MELRDAAQLSALANQLRGREAAADDVFESIYPAAFRESSQCFWTPVSVALRAAEWLVRGPETRVLDVGSGVGKMCIVGALSTGATFVGVERRPHFVAAAIRAAERLEARSARFVVGAFEDQDVTAYDGVYLFNPFEENILPMLRIDHDVEMEPQLYDDYTLHVQEQLERMPLATRVVTYFGSCAEVPDCYACVETAYDGMLKLWVKTRPAFDDN